jgi:hypothetical protein
VPPEDGDRIQSPKCCGFFRKNKTMDNVQLQKSFISKPSSLTFKSYLQGIPELNRFPYSPDLSLPDFFLFPKIKFTLKGRRFEDTEDIKINVTRELLALHANEFKKCFPTIL